MAVDQCSTTRPQRLGAAALIDFFKNIFTGHGFYFSGSDFFNPILGFLCP
ncbi:MAG: hypothetical protein Q8J63_06330 [Candidatus Aquicultor sp.]|nr:hypothetical protein [Candidatus Aquicultor sp.]